MTSRRSPFEYFWTATSGNTEKRQVTMRRRDVGSAELDEPIAKLDKCDRSNCNALCRRSDERLS